MVATGQGARLKVAEASGEREHLLGHASLKVAVAVVAGHISALDKGEGG